MGFIIPLPHTQRLIFLTQGLSLSNTFSNGIKDRFFGIEYRFLRDIGDTQTLLILQQSVIQFFHARQNLQ